MSAIRDGELVGLRIAVQGVVVEAARDPAGDWTVAVTVAPGAEAWRDLAIVRFGQHLDTELYAAAASSPRDRPSESWARSWQLHQIRRAFDRATRPAIQPGAAT